MMNSLEMARLNVSYNLEGAQAFALVSIAESLARIAEALDRPRQTTVNFETNPLDKPANVV